MANTELCFLNVTELAPLLRARKLSPVEIVHALLERIDTLNGDLIAYLHISAEHAHHGGVQSDGRLRRCRGFDRGGAPAAGWCHLPRQTQHYRICLRQYGSVWDGAQSMEYGDVSRRVELGLGHSSGGAYGASRHWQRHWRLDT